MKFTITASFCFLFLSIQAQFDIEKQQSYGLRFAVGISNMYDQESMNKVIPNSISKEISIYSMHTRKRWGARWELMWAQHTMFLVRSQSKFKLDYFNFSFAPVVASEDRIHKGYFGIYGGFLARAGLYDPVTKQLYVLSPIDLGAMVGYELSLHTRLKVNVHVRNSFLDLSKTNRSNASLTYGSKWLRNLNATIGLGIVLFKTQALSRLKE